MDYVRVGVLLPPHGTTPGRREVKLIVKSLLSLGDGTGRKHKACAKICHILWTTGMTSICSNTEKTPDEF